MISFAMANQTRHYMTFTTLHYEVHYVCHKYQDGMDCGLVKSLFCVTVTLSSLHSNHLIALPAHLHHEALPVMLSDWSTWHMSKATADSEEEKS